MSLGMKALVIMHAESEGPGSLGEFLASKGALMRKIYLYKNEELPRHKKDFDAMISMGGPMKVHEDEKCPFLKDETVFLREAIDSGMPVLGICLGAQMIAKACNAPVKKAPMKEIG